MSEYKSQKDTDPNNHKGYIPQLTERHEAIINSDRIMKYLNKAWLGNALSTTEYRDALNALEILSGVRWS